MTTEQKWRSTNYKGTDLSLLSKKHIMEIQNQINERPRKTLEYESPLNTISRLYINQNFI